MKNNVTICITSCGRIALLKKTIISLENAIDISQCKKIITEDSVNPIVIEKVKKQNATGFLKGWEVIYTGGKGKNGYEKHYNALKILYENITTPYIFHCEDDWYFKRTKTDFLKDSLEILEENSQVGIIQLRNFEKDGGLNKLGSSRQERKTELFKNSIFSYKKVKYYRFRNDEHGDIYKGFSLNPGLRRTSEMKDIMFKSGISKVDEKQFGRNMKDLGLESLCLKKGVCFHSGRSFMSTKLLEKGGLQNLENTILGTYQYRIKFLIINKKIKPLIFFFYKKMENNTFIRYILDYISYIYRKVFVRSISPSILLNREEVGAMNIPYSWFIEEKSHGISGVARLKNASEFLEKVVISHEPFLDEIVLVDNQSSDNTMEICLKLKSFFPDKVRIYSYDFEVYPPGKDISVTSDSLHSLAYYYNWCFSKSTKSHVMKLDDDNLLLESKWARIREISLKSKKYECYWGYNIVQFKNGNLGVPKGYMYSGKYGDHGIYPVSKKTYYLQGESFELFVNNLLYSRHNLSFFHLKFLKQGFGMQNLDEESEYYKEYYKKTQGNILNLEKVITNTGEEMPKNINIF